jgi:hypothetical protein
VARVDGENLNHGKTCFGEQGFYLKRVGAAADLMMRKIGFDVGLRQDKYKMVAATQLGRKLF